jgi:sugar porter (SP) family MFS transporter
MAPKAIRSRAGSMYQWFYTIGIFTSYWIDYGVVHTISPVESRMWQIPIAIQLVSSGLLFVGMFTVTESVRWLVREDRLEDAWSSLVWIRGETHDAASAATKDEFEEIQQGILEEKLARDGFSYKELFVEPGNRQRILISVFIFIFQQGTGATALAYFGPQFFQLIVGPGESSLLLTALFGAVKVAACTVFVLFVADRFGRRSLFIGGAAFMACCMLCTAFIYHFAPKAEDNSVSASDRAVIALLFLMVAAYNWSWGTLPFVYVPEIFSTRTREMGVTIALATHWLISFVFSISTPYMIQNIGWATFLFYAILDCLMTVFTYLFVKETKGRSLESIEQLFQSNAVPKEL